MYYRFVPCSGDPVTCSEPVRWFLSTYLGSARLFASGRSWQRFFVSLYNCKSQKLYSGSPVESRSSPWLSLLRIFVGFPVFVHKVPSLHVRVGPLPCKSLPVYHPPVHLSSVLYSFRYREVGLNPKYKHVES